MEPTTVILVVIFAALVPLSAFLFYRLGARGIDAGKALDVAGTVTQTANIAFDALKPLLPDHPAVSVLDAIFDGAQWGVGQAEQLYKTAQIGKDERKAKALEFIRQALAVAAIEVTPEIDCLITAAVDGAVAFLPKTHDAQGNILK